MSQDAASVKMSWEEAVAWLRSRPDMAELVRACYYDDPLSEAAQRFASSPEWAATRKYLPGSRGYALDIGAGRGISSYALASDGWKVTALEPDPGNLVGAGAIRKLSEESGLPINVVEERGEMLPFPDSSFDLVYGRQVLHHASDLPQFCKEVFRVLKPGGRFVATREHVISQPADLKAFLDSHPLHRFYGGENAYLLRQYIDAIRKSGLRMAKAIGPFEEPINYFPMSERDMASLLAAPVERIAGKTLTSVIANREKAYGAALLNGLAKARSRADRTPGRLYSFIADKPALKPGHMK